MMKVVFITKQGWLILLASCIFIIGNVVLLYRFVGKTSTSLADVPRLRGISDKYLKNVVAGGKLGGIAEVVNEMRKRPAKSTTVTSKESFSKHTLPKDEKEESLVIVSQHVEENHKSTDTNGNSVATEQRVKQSQTIVSSKMDEVLPSRVPADEVVAAVLVIACNRPTVKRCLDLLLQYQPSAKKFPIIVSQDCGHQETANVIASYGSRVTHIRQPDLSEVQGVPNNMRSMMGYYKISRHYKWAIGQVFDVMGYDTVIVVEDDLDVAPDFFEYFTATKPLLDKDPSLWCISAWNDNGKEGMVQRNDALYRTDFFPGLGWMITRNLWNELKPKWPLGFWDDWMRESAQRQGRACIRPEIPRTRTFGRVGVSHGQFFDQHLKYIKLNDKFHPFTKANLSYLLKDNYYKNFVNHVHMLPQVTVDQLVGNNVIAQEVQIHYSSEQDFQNVAKHVGAMTDFKAGIPRMAYQGIVSIVFEGKIVHLVPTD